MTIIETNKLIYATATVILGVFGNNMPASKRQYSPWRTQLNTKIKATQRGEKDRTTKVLLQLL